jgi:hypothetical protein
MAQGRDHQRSAAPDQTCAGSVLRPQCADEFVRGRAVALGARSAGTVDAPNLTGRAILMKNQVPTQTGPDQNAWFGGRSGGYGKAAGRASKLSAA